MCMQYAMAKPAEKLASGQTVMFYHNLSNHGEPMDYSYFIFIANSCSYLLLGINIDWMPAPEHFVDDCPPGLEYLLQIDRFIVSLRGDCMIANAYLY